MNIQWLIFQSRQSLDYGIREFGRFESLVTAYKNIE